MTQINETSYGKVIIRAVTASEAERVTSHTHLAPGSACLELKYFGADQNIFLTLHHAPNIFHRGDAACPLRHIELKII